MDDPFALLGVQAGASEDEVAAAYRAAAKRFHPDVAGDDADAEQRMAAINAAYEAIRSGEATPPEPEAQEPPRATLAAWLPEHTRRLLGRELLQALEHGEPIRLVADTATWASPTARLALTDRRVVWLHDDAITHRVRSLRLRDVVRVEQRLQWPRRRRATVTLHTRAGRRIAFADLAPDVAGELVAGVRGGGT